MILNLDLSALSPTTRENLLDAMNNSLRMANRRISQDLEYYEDGRAKQEMEDWAKAAIDVLDEVNEICLANNKRYSMDADKKVSLKRSVDK